MQKYTKQERMSRLIQGKSIDRVPLIINSSLFTAVFNKLNSKEYFFNMQNMYDYQKYTLDLFGCHGFPGFCLSNWIATSMGCENKYIDTPFGISVPQTKPIILSEKDVENFKAPKSLDSIEWNYRMEFQKICNFNGVKSTGVLGGSVVEILAQLVDMKLLMSWMIKKEDLVFYLCDEVKKYLKLIIQADIKKYGAENCTGLFFYPLESSDLLSPRMVKRINWRYIEEMHSYMYDLGIKKFHEHLCGNQNKNIELLKNLKLPSRSVFSLDERTDLQKTSSILGSEYIYSGNVSSNVLLNGSVNDVMNNCQDILKIGKKLEGGFILCPSCDLPPYTPPLNVYAMNKAIDKFGIY